MSRINVGTVSLGVVADASGVGPGVDEATKEINKLPKAADDASRKLDKITQSFVDLARATKLAKEAAAQFRTKGVGPGGPSPLRGGLGGRGSRPIFPDIESATSSAILADAKRELDQTKEAEKVYADARRRGQKLLRESKSTFYALAPGRTTRGQRAFLSDQREAERVGRRSLLTADTYDLLPEDGVSADERRQQRRRDRDERRAAARRLERFRSASVQRRINALLAEAGDATSEGQAAAAPAATGGGLRGRLRAGAVTAGGAASGAAGSAASFFANQTLGIASGAAGFFRGIVERALGYALGRLIGEVAGGIVGLAQTALDTTRKYEEQLVSFGVLTGSPARGTALVGSLQQLAVETPFKSSELLDQAKLLLSYGVAVDDVRGTLSRLGDVASGTGADLNRLSLAYGQVIAKGRLQGGELRQFTEAGVGVGDFASAYNETTGKNVGVAGFLGLVEQGQVGANVIERAFQRMTGAGGRFFGLMEARSQTVSGRIQALSESIELFTQRVGTSFFQNTGLGKFLDQTGKDIRNIDLGRLDQFFQGLDRTAGPFLGRVGRGVGSLFGTPGMPDWNSLDAALKGLTEKTIPDLLDGGKVVLNAFLEITRGALMAADALFRIGGFVYDHLPDQKYTGEILAGAAGAAAVSGRLGRAGTLGAKGAGRLIPGVGWAILAYEAYDYLMGGGQGGGAPDNPFGTGVVGGNFRAAAVPGPAAAAGGRVLPDLAARIGRQQAALRNASPSDLFRQAAGGQWSVPVFGEVPGNVQSAVETTAGVLGKVFADPKNVSARLEADRLNALNAIGTSGVTGWRTPRQPRDYRSRMIAAGIISDPKQPLYDAGILNDPRPKKPVNVTERDVILANGYLNKFGESLKGVGQQLDKLAEAALPGFGKRMEDIKAEVAAPADRPFDAFKNRMDDINMGVLRQKLTGPEADRARFLAFDALRDKMGATLGGPPQLMRAGTQDAETALTKAMNEFERNRKPTEEEIRDLVKMAYDRQEEQLKAETEISKTLKDIAKKPGGFNFVGIQFGGGR
jgi:tape measure domain-containing protein